MTAAFLAVRLAQGDVDAGVLGIGLALAIPVVVLVGASQKGLDRISASHARCRAHLRTDAGTVSTAFGLSRGQLLAVRMLTYGQGVLAGSLTVTSRHLRWRPGVLARLLGLGERVIDIGAIAEISDRRPGALIATMRTMTVRTRAGDVVEFDVTDVERIRRWLSAAMSHPN
ncbi:MAG: hypothetical protein JWO68_2656 [Actinomycetia bacterium]|nr:hypothetical protein [Actinomycetes bacterium]